MEDFEGGRERGKLNGNDWVPKVDVYVLIEVYFFKSAFYTLCFTYLLIQVVYCQSSPGSAFVRYDFTVL